MRLRCAGVTASRSSVLARGWPEDGGFERLRQRSFDALRRELGKTFRESFLSCHVSRSWHITLAMVNGPLLDPHGFVAVIDENRTTDLGAITVDELEVVSYRRLRASLRICALGRV